MWLLRTGIWWHYVLKLEASLLATDSKMVLSYQNRRKGSLILMLLMEVVKTQEEGAIAYPSYIITAPCVLEFCAHQRVLRPQCTRIPVAFNRGLANWMFFMRTPLGCRLNMDQTVVHWLYSLVPGKALLFLAILHSVRCVAQARSYTRDCSDTDLTVSIHSRSSIGRR